MTTFIKLGGSLITDKNVENSFHLDEMTRIASEIREAIDLVPDLQLLMGHGSGSFGHVAAKKHKTIEGVSTPEQWRGFAEVATVASQLNALVSDILYRANVPVWRIQPSASAISKDGVLESMALASIQTALAQKLVPLVYGDVALDTVRGGTIISTETIFFYLAQQLNADSILLLGEVDGVYDQNGEVIPEITPANFPAIEAALKGSGGVDVTGGMETKVRDMLALTQRMPQLKIRIMNGTTPDLLKRVLTENVATGTLIHAG